MMKHKRAKSDNFHGGSHDHSMVVFRSRSVCAIIFVCEYVCACIFECVFVGVYACM